MKKEISSPDSLLINALKDAQKNLKNWLSEIQKAIGFDFLDEELRIDPQSFENQFSQKEIHEDLENIKKQEEKFVKDTPEVLRGEIFEQAKTLAFYYVFREIDSNLIILRTSKYDDYFNKADELICNSKTGDVIALLDVTLDKAKTKEESRVHLVEIKYGIKIFRQNNEIKIEQRRLSRIPRFVVLIRPDELKKLVKGIYKFCQTESQKEKSPPSWAYYTVYNTVIYLLEQMKDQAELKTIGDDVYLKSSKLFQSTIKAIEDKLKEIVYQK